jgi:hypothetical protein
LQIHTSVERSGKTPFDLIGRLARAVGQNESPPDAILSLDVCADAVAFGRVEEAASQLVKLAKTAGPMREHPWKGVRNLQLQPMDLERFIGGLPPLSEAISALKKLCENGAAILNIAAPTTLREIDHFVSILQIVKDTPVSKSEAIQQLSAISSSHLATIAALAEAGLMLQETLAREQQLFHPVAIRADVRALRTKLAKGLTSWFARLGGDYRAASAELATYVTASLPKLAAERIALVDRLIALQEQRRSFSERGVAAAPMLGKLWAGEQTDFRAVIDAYLWLLRAIDVDIVSKLANVLHLASTESTTQRLLARIKDDMALLRSRLASTFDALELDIGKGFGVSAADNISFDLLIVRLETWSQAQSRYFEWTELYSVDQLLRNSSGAEIADRLADGRFELPSALSQITYARAEILWKHALRTNSQLNGIAKQNRAALVESFRRLEISRRSSTAALIRARHSANVPRGIYGDMAVIRGEVARRRSHMPTRKLMARAGSTIQKIKPVFMMSPISVSQYLPPGSVSFDLVVIDEASQIRPEDALGVVARGRQLVVVGDKKQLPPTTFFSRLLDDDGSDDDEEVDAAPQTALAGSAKVTDLESILTLSEARGIPSRMLRWHYRSRHPSLIEVSNAEFYKSNLFLPPSPVSERGSEGLVQRRIAGAYDRGGKRTNVIEAQAIVDAIARHAADQPHLSMGVVSFSTVQRDLIEDLLDEKRTKDPILESFLAGGLVEECFIKNLEKVQGDERDVILISVGYGPRMAGAKLDSMSFGPVSGEGGERRLNVLFTRARVRTEVFA